MSFFLTISILISVISIIIIVLDYDRSIILYFTNLDKLADSYIGRQTYNGKNRFVIECGKEQLSSKTLKSILDQSVRIKDSIYIKTENEESIKSLFRNNKIPSFISVISKDLSGENIIKITNGKEYPFNFIEDS